MLLIESGSIGKDSMIRMPRGIGKLPIAGNRHVWDYRVDHGNGQPEALWLKGRALEGSSINGTVYVRGAPADYDGWEARNKTKGHANDSLQADAELT